MKRNPIEINVIHKLRKLGNGLAVILLSYKHYKQITTLSETTHSNTESPVMEQCPVTYQSQPNDRNATSKNPRFHPYFILFVMNLRDPYKRISGPVKFKNGEHVNQQCAHELLIIPQYTIRKVQTKVTLIFQSETTETAKFVNTSREYLNTKIKFLNLSSELTFSPVHNMYSCLCPCNMN